MISDRELWACANEVLRQHGDRAPLFVAEQVGTRFSQRSSWRSRLEAIAARLDQLQPTFSPAASERH
jgi:hypothetical protein